jgi:hypothetical protein
MASLPQIALRGWTFLWTLLTLALVGNVIATAFAGNPPVVNYAIFVSVWSMLVLLFGIVGLFVEALAIPIALITVDALSVLFTLTVGIALAAELHAKSCGNQVSLPLRWTFLLCVVLTLSQSYISSNKLTNGSHDMSKRFHELQASTAFFWFMFAGFAGSLFFDVTGSGSSGISRRGGMHKGGPSMSQV